MIWCHYSKGTRVFSSFYPKKASAPLIQFHLSIFWDSDALVTLFMQDWTHQPRDYATFAWSRLPRQLNARYIHIRYEAMLHTNYILCIVKVASWSKCRILYVSHTLAECCVFGKQPVRLFFKWVYSHPLSRGYGGNLPSSLKNLY